MRESVQWFAEQMEARLKANDHKGGWERDLLSRLFDRLCEEAVELEQAIEGNATVDQIAREAADVANFAMMIADNARHAGQVSA